MIFVTGATGLVGNCIVRELLSRGEAVRALCRSGTSRQALDGLDVEIVEGDLTDSELLSAAFAGCDAVIHCAAMIHIGWTRLEESRLANVDGTGNVIVACLKQNVRLIYVSTVDTLLAAQGIENPINESSSDGVPKTPCSYVVSKREAESLVLSAVSERRLDAVIIHPGFMLAPFDWKPSSGRMMLEVCKAPLAVAPSGGCSLCDARDVAAAIVNSVRLGRTGEHYILAGENMSYQEMWTKVLATAGKRNRVYRADAFVRVLGRVLDFVNRNLPLPEIALNGAAIQMGQLFNYYSSLKAERELNYQRRDIQLTLDEAWHWLDQHHNRKKKVPRSRVDERQPLSSQG